MVVDVIPEYSVSSGTDPIVSVCCNTDFSSAGCVSDDRLDPIFKPSMLFLESDSCLNHFSVLCCVIQFD
jgi:hypothetical protein